MDSLYVVMPAYNEEENIEKTIREWYPVLEGKDPKSKLIVADSGSEDKTHEILNELKKEFPQLETLSDTDRQHGPKVIALYKCAISNNIEYVFQTDSDGQTDSQEFNEFWEQREKFDGLFGSRTHRGDGKQRSLVEKAISILLKMIFGVKVPDANAPFRLMNTQVLNKYINKLPEDYNIPNIMITTYYAYYEEKYKFIPISFNAREAGKNSLNIFKIVKIGLKSLGDFRRFKKEL